MKKIGIITLQSVNLNYGNKLQNYAVQQVFKNLGFDSDTIEWDNSLNKSFIRRMIKRLKRVNSNNSADDRLRNFQTFDKNNIYCKYISTTKGLDKKYDFFSVGSDQVWNPLWYNEERKNVYLLTFASDEKKICMAPSFGIDTLPDEWTDWFTRQLNSFPALSVREESGARIIKELTGREPTVVVDPTLLLWAEEWRELEKKPNNMDNVPYILTYFLSPKCNEAKEVLETNRKERKVHELLLDSDSIVATAGPSEFLYLFDHADLVLTDSFHACVFAFLFNKPFIVFDRRDSVDMSSRLVTLLSKFGLERKYYSSGLENDIWEHDYTEGYKQLEIERKKAIKFLKEALGEN